MLDYIAIERADPDGLRGDRPRPGARRGAGRDRDPGRRAGPARRHGQRLRHRRRLLRHAWRSTRSSTARAVEPGDPVIGLPSSGLHSNGYTLARSALEGISLGDDRLGRPLGRGPARADRDLRQAGGRAAARPTSTCAGSPTSPRAASATCCGCAAEVGYEIDDPLPVPPVFELIAERGAVAEAEMYEVFNMGCGFCCVVAAADEEAALELLRGHYPAARRIGRAARSARGPARGRPRARPFPRGDHDERGTRQVLSSVQIAILVFDRLTLLDADRPLRGAALGPGLGGALRRPRAGRAADRQRRDRAGRRPRDRGA